MLNCHVLPFIVKNHEIIGLEVVNFLFFVEQVNFSEKISRIDFLNDNQVPFTLFLV